MTYRLYDRVEKRFPPSRYRSLHSVLHARELLSDDPLIAAWRYIISVVRRAA